MIEPRRLRQRASSGTARSWRPSDLILPGTRSSPLSPTILVARGVSGEEFPAATGGGCVPDSGDAAEDDGGGGRRRGNLEWWIYLLTANLAQQGKTVGDSVLGSGFVEFVDDREVWVADTGSTLHVTGNPFRMVECRPHPPDKSSLVVSDMRSLKIGLFVKFHGHALREG